jgi:hypothetical protein
MLPFSFSFSSSCFSSSSSSSSCSRSLLPDMATTSHQTPSLQHKCALDHPLIQQTLKVEDALPPSLAWRRAG